MLVLSALLAAAPDARAAGPGPAGEPPSGRYIVRLRPGGLMGDVLTPLGVRPTFVYHTVLHGFAARLTSEQLDQVYTNPDVAYSGVIAGLDWIAAHVRRPAVANIFIGGARSSAVDDAANELSSLGVFIVAAAGDRSIDACDVSPASSPGTLAVAASSPGDTFAPGGNTGHCVDLFAPGVNVTSARMGGGISRATGSAFAAPYVTGVAALFKQAHGDASSSCSTGSPAKPPPASFAGSLPGCPTSCSAPAGSDRHARLRGRWCRAVCWGCRRGRRGGCRRWRGR
ncbi:S8 family serine peptidase [Sphaerisporangium corydalis]|uniref:S8 family serine peptidase n=1 Tax=Sphaerisporangium corydalis TaxID=1441875 RepID=A0ABV9EUD0_9ACTN|nr:S8 family serine peptidase [Sphaerisporangium corydalis]